MFVQYILGYISIIQHWIIETFFVFRIAVYFLNLCYKYETHTNVWSKIPQKFIKLRENDARCKVQKYVFSTNGAVFNLKNQEHINAEIILGKPHVNGIESRGGNKTSLFFKY